MFKEWFMDNPFLGCLYVLGFFLFVSNFKNFCKILFFLISIFVTLVKLVLWLILLAIYQLMHRSIIKNTVENFEKSINNEGIKNDNIDVSACHTYLNRIGADGIEFLIEIYKNKIVEELNKENKDEKQIDRYTNLLEIMSRCLYYNR